MTDPVTVTVLDSDGAPQPGLADYAFNGAAYTGYSRTTDVNGQASFTLPSGNYRFRADKNGTQFFSGASNHCAIPGCTSASITVATSLTVTVLDTDGAPQSGLAVYAFNGATYTGYGKTTDSSGQATFTLPQGSYRFRADRSGQQYFSDAVNHCTLPGCTNVTITIPVTGGFHTVGVLAAPAIGKLDLTAMCSPYPALFRHWRVRNPNPFALEYSAVLASPFRETYTGVVPPAKDGQPGVAFFISTAANGENEMELFARGALQAAAVSEGERCSSPQEAFAVYDAPHGGLFTLSAAEGFALNPALAGLGECGMGNVECGMRIERRSAQIAVEHERRFRYSTFRTQHSAF